jgi:hypothetical protein
MRLPAPALPPTTVLAAMGIAIGGAVLSAGFLQWVIATDQSSSHEPATYSLIADFGLVFLNAGLLYAMSLHQRWAWGLTCALVIVGGIVELLVFTPVAYRIGYLLLFLSPALALGGTAGITWSTWLWVHVAVVQVPILVLLLAPSSRRWFEAGKPTSSRKGETPAW